MIVGAFFQCHAVEAVIGYRSTVKYTGAADTCRRNCHAVISAGLGQVTAGVDSNTVDAGNSCHNARRSKANAAQSRRRTGNIRHPRQVIAGSIEFCSLCFQSCSSAAQSIIGCLISAFKRCFSCADICRYLRFSCHIGSCRSYFFISSSLCISVGNTITCKRSCFICLFSYRCISFSLCIGIGNTITCKRSCFICLFSYRCISFSLCIGIGNTVTCKRGRFICLFTYRRIGFSLCIGIGNAIACKCSRRIRFACNVSLHFRYVDAANFIVTVGAFFQCHTIKAVAGDSCAVDLAVCAQRYAVETSACYRCTIDSFGGHSAFFIDCKTRTAERCISLADHGIAAHGQPRAGIRAADGYAVDTCNACQSAVHFNVADACQTAEHICTICTAKCIFISGFVSEVYLIGSTGHTRRTNSNAV